MSSELTKTPNSVDDRSAQQVVFYLARAMEAVWLLAAFTVPVVVLSPGLLLGHVDTPKVGLVKSAAALITILWLMQLVVAPGIDAGVFRMLRKPRLRSVPSRTVAWVRADPYRWALAAMAVLFAAYLLSVALSASTSVSIWGRRPGGDGYGLYNMLAVAMLGVAIASHLRSRAQVYRLLSVISAAGTVVGVYAISQHFGYDPILDDLANSARSESSLGNPIFAGAVLVITLLTTATLALALWREGEGRVLASLAVVGVAVQVLGLTYTLSRGPWVGASAGAIVLVAVVSLALGRKLAVTAGAIVAGTLIAAVVAAAIIGAVRSSEDRAGTADSSDFSAGSRVLSIYSETAGGSLSLRYDIWKATMELSGSRPWPDTVAQSNSWARHPFGYGPDLYRFVFPLTSPPNALASFAFEAHNVPLHVLAEMGIIGFIALIVAWLVVPGVGLLILLRDDERLPLVGRILLVGLLAVFAGRSVEMMAGIPKIADLALLAMLVGVFFALPRIRWDGDSPENTPTRQSRDDNGKWQAWAGLIARAVVILTAIVALSVFSWFKVGNYALADGEARLGIAKLSRGEDDGVNLILKSIGHAPDVPEFYLVMVNALDASGSGSPNADTRRRTALGRYVNAGRALEENPLHPDPRVAQATAAIDLHILGDPGFIEVALQRTLDISVMYPSFAISHVEMGRVLLIAEFPEEALVSLDTADEIIKLAPRKDIEAESRYLRGIALRQLGDQDGAAVHLRASLDLDPGGRFASNALRALAEIDSNP